MFSRDAQIVATSIFGRGNEEVTFQTPSRIAERTRVALDELVEKGAIKVTMQGCAEHYCAVSEVIGRPIRDFEIATEEEDFPLVNKIT